MFDQAQTATDQQHLQLLQRLDLIIGEWMSSSTITTLPEPKKCVVSSCIKARLGSRKRSLQVQMYGSGSVVVPRFPFDDATTVGELFGAVREHAPVGKRPRRGVEKVDRLIFGGDEEKVVVNRRQETSTCIASLGITDNAVGFVIMINGAKILAKRKSSHLSSATVRRMNYFMCCVL